MYDPNDYPDNREGGGGGNLIPAGKHIARIIEHEHGTTSGGYAQLIVTFEAADGRTRRGYFIYEGRAAFQLAALCRACNYHEPLDVESSIAVRTALHGKDVQIVVVDEVYQGSPQTKVKYVNPLPGSKPSSTRTTRQPSDNEPPPPGDDDLPF